MFNTHRYYLIQPEPKADTGDKKSAATADEDSKVLVNMISTEVNVKCGSLKNWINCN